MAGDWIKWLKGLARRREIIVLARKLGITRREAACACMEMWEWADDETVDGHIQGATGDDIDLMLGLPGFAAALESDEVDWLRVNSRGITFVRWDRNNGETAKKRALENRKKNRQRKLRKSVASRSERDKRPDAEQVLGGTREEKRREENTNTPPPTPSKPTLPAKTNLGEEGWGWAEVSLRERGLSATESAIRTIVERRLPPELVRAIIARWDEMAPAYQAGALLVALQRAFPGDAAADPRLWPSPSDEWQKKNRDSRRAEVDAAKEARRKAERRADEEAKARERDREAKLGKVLDSLPEEELREMIGSVYTAASAKVLGAALDARPLVGGPRRDLLAELERRRQEVAT